MSEGSIGSNGEPEPASDGPRGEGQLPAPPPAPTIEVCYRHPSVQTRVHCTRCGRPICPDCMIPAPVGFQCPECVERARRDFRRGPGHPLRGGLSPTRFLLGAILAVFVVEVVVGGPGSLFRPSGSVLFDLGAMQPIAVASGQFWRLFSAMFLHAGAFHIMFNAYALYLFGPMIESSFGRTWMVVIYAVSGFLASVASFAFGPLGSLAVGASGAIFGIFGAFVAYNYRRRYLSQAAANLRWAMTLILLNTLLVFAFGAIDWRAHVGGFVAGFAAGYVVEGVGPPRVRPAVRIAGIAALVALGVALAVWRTTELRAIPNFDQLVDQVFAFYG